MALIAAAFLGGLLLTSPAMAKDYKLVVQMSSKNEKAHKRTLQRIGQLLKALKGETVEVAVVAIGPGFNLVAKYAEKKFISIGTTDGGMHVEAVKKLMKKGVVFFADKTTVKMMGKHGMPTELIKGVKLVPNGAAQILKLQDAGYHYQAMFF